MKLHELQEQRSAAVTAMRALADKIEGESRDYTADEETRHAALKAEISGLDAKITRARDIADAERAAPAIIAGNGRDGAYEERARSFSIVRAIQAQCGDVPFDGLEREISKELSTRTGRHFEGIGVPDQALETRTLTVAGDAASLYPTQHRPDLFVDLRRSAMVTGSLGATMLSGLVGDQSIPRQIQASTAYHVAEDGDVTTSDADFDDIELSPKTVGALTSFSRRALINAQPSVENLVRRDLAAVVARAIDFQALFGTGAGNTPKRNESLGIVISTQAATDQHPLSILIDDAARGNDPSTYLQITAAPQDCDPFDEELWQAVNPAWGKFLDEGEFRAQAERARRVPSFLARFCNLRLNMRIEAEERFLSAPDWRACGADIDVPALKGRRCYLGLDLSSTTDLTALAAYFPETGELLAWFWKPAEGLDEAERLDHVPYKTWARLGHLETTPGRAIDKAFVAHRLGEIVQDYDVAGLAFDRWGMKELERILVDEGIKLNMEPWDQSWQDMGPALDATETVVLQGKLRHPKNPVLDMCVANAVAVTNPAGARKLDKAKSTTRIDGLQAAAMAIGLAARTPGKKASVYQTRGLLTVNAA